MKETFPKVTNMVWVQWLMFQEINMKVIGKQIKKMASEQCIGLLEQMKNILENGKIINKMVLVYIFGLKKEEKINILEIDMKDIGKMVKEMEREPILI